MSGKLADEIKQTKPFGSLAEEALLNVHRTASKLAMSFGVALKPYGLTETQYNVLRILRGAGQDGISCQEIGARLITREPDLTRLLERMKRRGLIARVRSSQDRRVVVNRISPQGLELLSILDAEARRIPKQALGHLSDKELLQLIDLLEKARERE
jgi:DNA-binding MarR family transcriptional regulator